NIQQKDSINLILKSQKILILPSSPLDGDSLGSTVALYIVLKKLGKEVTAVCTDPIPDSYQFLPSENAIQRDITLNRDFIVTVDCSETELAHIEHQVQNDKVNIVLTPKKGEFSEKNVTFRHGQSKYDLIIVVDAGDLEQLGKLYDDHTEFFFTTPVINIDHHASNSEFGRINLVDVMASSTTEILFDLIKELKPGENFIDPDVATALLAGIITDTGSFQNANTTPKSLEYASDLVDLGARQQEIIKNVYKTKRLSTLKLWGKILTKMRSDEKYRFIWSSLTLEDFMETKSGPEETGDIIDELMTNAPGMEIALILKEREPEFISGSLRSTTDQVDVSKIAAAFGGGGHVRAAGFRVKGKNFETIEREVIDRIRQYQSERLFLDEKVTEVPKITFAPKTHENLKPQENIEPLMVPALETGENQKLRENREPLMVSAPEEILELMTHSEPESTSLKRKSEFQSEAGLQPEARLQSQPERELESQSEPELQQEQEPQSNTEPEVPSESRQETEPRPELQPKSESEPEPQPELQSKSQSEPESESELERELQPQQEIQSQSQAETQSELEAQPEQQLQSEPKQELQTEELLPQSQLEPQPQSIDLKTSKIFGPKNEAKTSYANKLPPNLSDETKKKKMKKKEILVEDLLKKASGNEEKTTPYSFEP
ncbi:DHH family phosphoesterase, partial [Candidatus Peregrinibacteria bacterium]|nr:DHH family phosphoesterase [Candidatus Peregrinibacteria bacterium]